jgi:hypothetical protein
MIPVVRSVDDQSSVSRAELPELLHVLPMSNTCPDSEKQRLTNED